MGLSVTNIWKPFGLRRDPFFQEELKADPESEYPVQELFVGRAAELERIGQHVGGSDPSRTIVEGGAGVGKTSFVNRLKVDLAAHGFLVHDQPVRVSSRSDAESFLADVLRVLVRIHALRDGGRDDFWKTAAFLVEGGTVTSGGLNLGPAGFQFHRERYAAETGRAPMIEIVGTALARTRETIGAPVLLHVNNLENLHPDATKTASTLMQDVRDVFSFSGAHWLMVGASGIERAVFRTTPQVSGFFPFAISLEPLTPTEVGTLLERRYAHLAEPGKDVVPPVEPETAVDLYAIYRGDLRNFLRLLSEAANLLLGVDGVRPLTTPQTVRTMGKVYRDQVIEAVGAQDFDYIERLARGSREAERGFRVSEVTEWLGVSQPGASGIVTRLLDAGLIVESVREGRSVYYRLTGAAAIATGQMEA